MTLNGDKWKRDDTAGAGAGLVHTTNTKQSKRKKGKSALPMNSHKRPKFPDGTIKKTTKTPKEGYIKAMQEKLDGMQVESAVGRVMYGNTTNNTYQKFGNADLRYFIDTGHVTIQTRQPTEGSTEHNPLPAINHREQTHTREQIMPLTEQNLHRLTIAAAPSGELAITGTNGVMYSPTTIANSRESSEWEWDTESRENEGQRNRSNEDQQHAIIPDTSGNVDRTEAAIRLNQQRQQQRQDTPQPSRGDPNPTKNDPPK